MADNPYQPPSYAASLEKQREQHDLATRLAAGQFVANARSSSYFHLVGGLLCIAIPLIALADSKAYTMTPYLFAAMWGTGMILLVWGALQYHANLMAVLLTGLACAVTIFFFAATMIAHCRNEESLVGWLAVGGAGAILVVILSWPIRLSIQACLWWSRGLDPVRIAEQR